MGRETDKKVNYIIERTNVEDITGHRERKREEETDEKLTDREETVNPILTCTNVVHITRPKKRKTDTQRHPLGNMKNEIHP